MFAVINDTGIFALIFHKISRKMTYLVLDRYTARTVNDVVFLRMLLWRDAKIFKILA